MEVPTTTRTSIQFFFYEEGLYMKLVDRDRAHPILIHAMSGPRTFVPWEQSLAKQEID